MFSQPIASNDQVHQRRYVLLQQLLVAVSLALGVSFCLLEPWGSDQRMTIHTVMELACIFVALGVFFTSWLSHQPDEAVVRDLGLGYLAVAIADTFHAYCYIFLANVPPAFPDLGAKFWIVGRLAEASVLLSVTLFSERRLHSRRTALVACLTGCLVASWALLVWPNLLPRLHYVSGGVTPIKTALEILVIVILLMAIYRTSRFRRAVPLSGLLLASMICTGLSELCFVAYGTITSFLTLVGHLLKLGSFWFLFRSLVITAVTLPYQRVRAAHDYLASLLNNLSLGVITVDIAGRIDFANRRACELAGPELEQYYGQSAAEVFQSLGASDRNLLPLLIGQEEMDQVIDFQRPSGKTQRLRIESHRLADGGKAYLLDEASKETNLGRLRIQTRHILDAVSDMILLVDADGLVLACNNAFQDQTGLSAAEVEGLDLLTVSHRLCSADCVSVLPKIAELPQETTFVDRAGEARQILIKASEVHNLDGELTGRVILGSDITELKHAEARLHQHEKLAALGQMAAGLVHEIRNPLTTIKGFNQMLMGRMADSRLLGFSRMMDAEINTMNRIISDFLELSKPRQPRMQLTRLSTLVEPLALLLESHAFLNGVDFHLESPSDDTTLLVDKGQIQQVVLNMVKNACEAMSETAQPRLRIKLSATSGFATISIQDNGPGINGVSLAKLGTPFFTTKPGGTGLGLNMCYQIIDEHGGHTRVESELGKGTTFHVYLPTCVETGQRVVLDS